MTAAAARKKPLPEFDADAAAEKRVNRMWIDPAWLPTTLAQTGKKQELEPLTPWSGVKREHPPNRILDYADLVLGTKKKRRAVDKKSNRISRRDAR